MLPNPKLKGYFLFAVVLLIGFLLMGDIYLTYQNARIITLNKKIHEETETTKVNTLHILRDLNLMDLGLRGYALVDNPQIAAAMDSALNYTNRAFAGLEVTLISQGYQMDQFYQFKDSVNSYYKLVAEMRHYLETDQREKFLSILTQDRGFQVWRHYQNFSQNIYSFEDQISTAAKIKYDEAVRNIYMVQILLFILAMPTLMYTAYYTNRTLKISDRLRKVEEERNKMLANQNQALELMVKERTNEILAQNEEIAAHNEQLLLQQQEIENQQKILTEQNEQLREAQKIIETQSNLIKTKNEALTIEVDRQTQDLRRTNLELAEQNNRLEQFAYIISHNLRAPMARLAGLATVLELAKNEVEKTDIIRLMIKTTGEFDKVIQDLSKILSIKNLNTHVLDEVHLDDPVDKAMLMLDAEIKETKARVVRDFRSAQVIYSLPQYIESIFYNLISNAIKYRHPERHPVIRISSKSENEFFRIEITDNGLGIDLEKHKNNLFSLYKRFHFHVEGKGLGLYLVKTQLDALGGKIEVKSTINEGTTFTLLLKK